MPLNHFKHNIVSSATVNVHQIVFDVLGATTTKIHALTYASTRCVDTLNLPNNNIGIISLEVGGAQMTSDKTTATPIRLNLGETKAVE